MKFKNLAIGLIAIALVPSGLKAERLTILHTNDTHSQIDPTDKNLGGALRRKVLIDSVRNAEKNTLLIDAGDAVQGTLYFNLYKGEAEHKMMNFLGYDFAILGNHDFDNGVEALAQNLKEDRAQWLTTNYSLKGSPLEGNFSPYAIKRYGDKSVGFIGINLNPKGMISEGNYDGVVYLDAIKAANSTAWHLKHNEGVDYVIAITHIGYEPSEGPGDVELANKSEDIDIIIGGHSHDTIDPTVEGSKPWLVANANGRQIPVVQTGKSGLKLGEISLDLDNGTVDYKLIPVDKRLDASINPEWNEMLRPYREGIDSLMNVKIGKSPIELGASSAALLNLTADFILETGGKLTKQPLDMAIINKGGLRRSIPQGNVTKGVIMTMLPFDNKILVLELKGSDLLESFEVMARRNGDGVSRGVDVKYNPADGSIISATINGKPIDPNATYHIATIDYLQGGGDYMVPLTRGTVIAKSDKKLSDAMIDWWLTSQNAKKLKIDNTIRMSPNK